jgi:hypothetical protein
LNARLLSELDANVTDMIIGPKEIVVTGLLVGGRSTSNLIGRD